LKQPIIARRIKTFLNEEYFKEEFSHTILHKQHINLNGPPKPLVPPSLPVASPQILRNPSAGQLVQAKP
jgi:hypothetical protein